MNIIVLKLNENETGFQFYVQLPPKRIGRHVPVWVDSITTVNARK